MDNNEYVDYAVDEDKLGKQDRDNECATVILKLMLVSTYFTQYEFNGLDGREVCDTMNSFVANIAFCANAPALESVNIFRKALTMCFHVLNDIVQNPVVYAVTGEINKDDDEYKLNLCMMDILRTFCYLGETNSYSMTATEFSKLSRSSESQSASNMCNFMRRCDDSDREAYTTADYMYLNFERGLSNLQKLCHMEDCDMLTFIENATGSTNMFLNSFIIPCIFDGNRMICSNAIATRFYGDAKNPNSFGKPEFVTKLFCSNSDCISISRVVLTICAILSMAKCSLYITAIEAVITKQDKQMMSPNEKRQFEEDNKCLIHQEAKGMPQWNKIVLFAHKIKIILDNTFEEKNDIPGTNTKLMSTIADWFEEGVRDSETFSIFTLAFSHESFCIDRPCKEVKDAWKEFRNENSNVQTNNASLWFASQFLVTCRLELHDPCVCGSNIFITSMIVMSGAIGNLIGEGKKDRSSVSGPFKFAPHIKNSVLQMYDKFGSKLSQLRIPLCRQTSKIEKSGKKCGMTQISREILNQKQVRRQNEKSRLNNARLRACMFMTSIKECLVKDVRTKHESIPKLKLSVDTAPTEGRKGLRRLYIISLQTFPNIKNVACYLVEQTRNSIRTNKTTCDNVEKPWRDINGGMYLSTFFYPLAGKSFVSTIATLVIKYRSDSMQSNDDNYNQDSDTRNCNNGILCDDSYQFKCTTKQAVNEFVNCFQTWLKHMFPPAMTIKPEFGLVKEDYTCARLIVAQQISVAMNYSQCIWNTSTLWEDMNLTFSVQKEVTNRNKRRKRNSSNTI
jgi:hypothetical protein